LPCTERNMTTTKVEATVTRGLMPVIGIKGRDVVRLGSFQSLAGQEIAGRWSGNPPPARAAGGRATFSADIPTGASAEAELDALLAGFGDAPTAADPAAIDAELAALLEGL
jgi:pilus assembly protein FimV